MTGRPTGTVTFLFTDIESSTRLWEEHPEAMSGFLERHDRIIHGAVEANQGLIFSTGGDGVGAAFPTGLCAITAAVDAQLALQREKGDLVARVRMGIHTGEAVERDGNYFGPPLNRCARLMAVAHGGQILCSGVISTIVADELEGYVWLRDLGVHRLLDLGEPERIFEVVHPELPSDFPKLSSFEAYPSNLPILSTAFIGREQERQRVLEALREARLVTLTGVGGVGKTRLALQIAAESLPDHRDGVWVIDLSSVMDAAALETAIATAVEIPEEVPRATVAEALRGKQLLLVIDNCEHLVDAVARLVEEVVTANPDLSVLATSREGLAINGERIVPIPPLDLPTEETLEAAQQSGAVTLFTARAAEVFDGFTLNAQNAATISKICRRLDGIPLALELAAARVPSLAPNDILSRLDQRFQLLTGGRRTAVNRQQTLRRAIDWSYDLLSDDERGLLRRLSVFAGSCDLAAIQAVCGLGINDEFEVANLMERLVAKSLIIADTAGPSVRYNMLETIHDYGSERLEETNESNIIGRRHMLYFADLAERFGTGIQGPDEGMWIRRVERDLENLRSALLMAISTGEVDVALRMITSVAIPAHWASTATAFGTWALEAAGMPGAKNHPLRPAAVAMGAFWEAHYNLELESALEHAKEALVLSERLDPKRQGVAKCWAYSALTSGSILKDETEGVIEWAKEWLEIATGIEDPAQQAQSACILSLLHLGLSVLDIDAAIEWGEFAVEKSRIAGNPTNMAFSLTALGQALTDTDPRRALEVLGEGLACARVVRNRLGVLLAEGAMSGVNLGVGDIADSARGALSSVQKANEEGIYGHSGPFIVLARSLKELGDEESAHVIGAWMRSQEQFIRPERLYSFMSTLDEDWEEVPLVERQRIDLLVESMSFEQFLSYVSSKLTEALDENEPAK